MLRKLALVLVLCATALSGKGQVYFDNLFGQTTSADGIPTGGAIRTQNGYLILSSQYNGQQNHFGFQIDSDGEYLNGFYLENSDTISELGGFVLAYSDSSFIGMSQWDDLNQSSDVIGDVMLTHFNEEGGVYWRRKYGLDDRTENSVMIVYCHDKEIAIVGQTINFVDSEADGQAYLSMVDSLGNQIWEWEYGGNLYDAGMSAVQTTDQGFLLLGWSYSFGNGQRDFYLVKTDSLGEQEWQETYGGGGDEGGSCIIELNDGNYLLTGSGSQGAAGSLGRLYKITPAGEVIWEHTYIYPGNSGNNFHKSVELWNGDLVSVGLTDRNSNSGWLVRTNSLGEVIWQREYDKNENTDLFYSVLLAEDGGFLLSGQARNAETNSQDAWLLKVDSVGCPYPNCLVGVDEAEPSKVMVDVWPNPTSEVLHLELQQQGAAEIMLYDMAGKLMLQKQTTQQREALDVSTLENGLYLLTVLQGDMKTTVKVMVW